MKKLLGILVLGLLWCNVSFAKDFKYKTLTICGPKKVISYKIDIYEETKPYFEHQYYYIHFDKIRFDKEDNFVIFNYGTEYASFTKRYYSDLYPQRGKVTSAKLNVESETVYKFQLITEWKGKKRYPTMITYLNYDKEAKTYSIFSTWGSEKSELETGVCWWVQNR